MAGLRNNVYGHIGGTYRKEWWFCFTARYVQNPVAEGYKRAVLHAAKRQRLGRRVEGEVAVRCGEVKIGYSGEGLYA